jgi:hypothetical protein
MDDYEPIEIHALTYTVPETTEHLVAHGIARPRLEWLLAHGVAMFFATATELHRWVHELEWWRADT